MFQIIHIFIATAVNSHHHLTFCLFLKISESFYVATHMKVFVQTDLTQAEQIVITLYYMFSIVNEIIYLENHFIL